MLNFDKDKIFNKSPQKVLIREYENLKKNYSKMNALKYKELYENASLSFILENSRYIFSEPLKGLDFYKNVISEATLPLYTIRDEYDKVHSYYNEYSDNMSEGQRELYSSLIEKIDAKYESTKWTSGLYNEMMENVEALSPVYDALYENKDMSTVFEMFKESCDSINIMDAINIAVSNPDVSDKLYAYIESAYVNEPTSAEDYALNTCTSKILNRMMKDQYFSESFNNIPNMNLRTLIKGLAQLDDNDMYMENTTEVVSTSTIKYEGCNSSINDVFESYMGASSGESDDEILANMIAEQAVTDINNGFAIMDYLAHGDEKAPSNKVVINECVTNGITEAPQTMLQHVTMLESIADKLESEIDTMCEKYSNDDGSPSLIISRSLGTVGNDDTELKSTAKAKVYTPEIPVKSQKDDPENNDDKEKPASDENDSDESKKEDSHKNMDDDEADDIKRQAAKNRQTDKYANMDIDDDIFESVGTDVNAFFEDGEIEEIPEAPEKKGLLRRIQNKALETNVRFKRRVANGRRTAQEGRNALKATSKIPLNVTSALKKTVDDWDEMDDNRRKAYIIKPGYRKKYFRALKLCIIHYGAFAINPVLNIVLFICQKMSKSKDVRIRNELIRELETEVKVCDEKIEDAKSNGDSKQKYKLMRIRDRLNAELLRVKANTTVI